MAFDFSLEFTIIMAIVGPNRAKSSDLDEKNESELPFSDYINRLFQSIARYE